jgi:hypothetical protein
MTRQALLALVLVACAPAAAPKAGTDDRPLEGRAPTTAELTPSVEAAFARESYAPGVMATLVISNPARGVRMQILRSGPERIVTRSNLTMNGVPVSPRRLIGSSTGRRTIRVRIGDWPSGLYFARLRATDGRVGFAPSSFGRGRSASTPSQSSSRL